MTHIHRTPCRPAVLRLSCRRNASAQNPADPVTRSSGRHASPEPFEPPDARRENPRRHDPSTPRRMPAGLVAFRRRTVSSRPCGSERSITTMWRLLQAARRLQAAGPGPREPDERQVLSVHFSGVVVVFNEQDTGPRLSRVHRFVCHHRVTGSPLVAETRVNPQAIFSPLLIPLCPHCAVREKEDV